MSRKSETTGDGAPSRARETIILVHGTFAAPKAGAPGGERAQWYQRNSDFVRRLDARLAELGSPARCWAHLPPDGGKIFSWSGENTWIARAAAARDLNALLSELIDNKGWRCHLIAHSHGGTVLLEALSAASELGLWDWRHGYLVTMGTPVIETFPTRGSQRFGVFRVALLSLMSYAALALAAFCFGWLSWPGFSAWIAAAPLTWTIVAGVLLAGLVAWGFLWGALAFGLVLGLATSRLSPEWKRLLIMNSKHDEAFQLLSRIVPMKNPFARKSAVSRSESLRAWWQANRSLFSLVDNLRFPTRSYAALVYLVLFAAGGVALLALPADDIVTALRAGYGVFAALLLLITLSEGSAFARVVYAPGRLLYFMLTLAASAFFSLVGFVVRCFAWSQLQRHALGTAGFPFATRPVSTTPQWVGDDFYEYKPLSDAVVERALASRNQGIGSSVDLITDFLAHGDMSFDSIDLVLKRIVSDTTLVHAAYYTDPDAIEDVAQWLARSEVDLQREASETQLF